MSISLCMIVKNEQDNLPRCLESIKDIVDEMIIVDTGSTDSTVEIAESYGARVYHFPWNGSFSDARNYSLKHASGDWIMIMDADDELPGSEKQAVLDLAKTGDADAYFFETISYVGDKPGVDVLKNLNLRLMRNGKGYFYSNAIHEQIYCNIKAVNPSASIVNKDIKVYHYGYLNKNIEEHNKRARNISLLEKELEEKPGYAFALFNLGSEYYATGDNVKAIKYFEESYKKFNPQEGFSSHLLLKMVHCLTNLGRFEDALKIIEEGLGYFPAFTDLEYMRAVTYNMMGKQVRAIKHFEKCCEMGEAPSYCNVIIGTGTYRAHFMLGDIYFNLGDYDLAMDNFKHAIEQNPQMTSILPKLITACCKNKPGQKALIENIEALRIYQPENFNLLVFDILVQEKYYDLALKYMEKFEKDKGSSPYTRYSKGLCKLFLKKYNSAYMTLEPVKKDAEYRVKAVCAQALCKIIGKKYSQASRLLSSDGLDQNNRTVKTYISFNTFMETGQVKLLSDNEQESAGYTVIIFDLLKILVRIHEFEIFEKALNLLNAIEDKSVLLKLAKLYYAENCFGLACKEFLRSVKIFDLIDAEGANMLYKLKLRGL